eukprot:scaffold657549_cov80-Prasinocladus_malaysianus.AAC.1
MLVMADEAWRRTTHLPGHHVGVIKSCLGPSSHEYRRVGIIQPICQVLSPFRLGPRPTKALRFVLRRPYHNHPAGVHPHQLRYVSLGDVSV